MNITAVIYNKEWINFNRESLSDAEDDYEESTIKFLYFDGEPIEEIAAEIVKNLRFDFRNARKYYLEDIKYLFDGCEARKKTCLIEELIEKEVNKQYKERLKVGAKEIGCIIE